MTKLWVAYLINSIFMEGKMVRNHRCPATVFGKFFYYMIR
jgi:hypothetical protein